MTKAILVVCLGNICRSPLAEAIFLARIAEAGLDIRVESAGTGGWHIGEPPDARAVVAARLKGYDITKIRSRKIMPSDFETFDMIFAADTDVMRDVEMVRPDRNATPVALLTSLIADDDTRPSDIPDPYYTGKFNAVIQTLEECADAFVAQLRNARQ